MRENYEKRMVYRERTRWIGWFAFITTRYQPNGSQGRMEQRRKRGVQGKAVEYHFSSLPEDVFNVLSLNDNSIDYRGKGKRQDAFLIWVEAYKQLTKKEREKIIKFILREGLEKLIGYINCCEAILVE